MNASEFDGLLRKKFEQHEFAFQPEDWAKLQDQLDKQMPVRKSRNRPFFLLFLVPGMAASVAAIACCVYFIQHVHSYNMDRQALSRAGNTTRQVRQARLASDFRHTIETTTGNNQSPAVTVTMESTMPAEHVREMAAALLQATPPSTTGNDGNVQVSLADPSQTTAGTVRKQQYQRIDLAFNENAYEEEQRRNRNTSLSIGGGFNYGSMNAGYSVGINARRNISKKLFVEGDVAMVNNATRRYSETNTTTTFALSPARMSPKAKMTNGEPMALDNNDFKSVSQREVTSQVTQLYYIQLAPTIGYQLCDELSIGAGPDFQQLLQSEEKKVVYETNDKPVESLPSFDVGLQAKAEVFISRKLKASLQYRKGVNDAFQKSSNYVNRNYMQVQVKYTLFGK